MEYVNRRDAMRLGILGGLAAAGALIPVQTASAGMYVLRWGFLDIFKNLGHWATYNANARYMLWNSGGRALDSMIRQMAYESSLYTKATEYKLTGKASGTRVPDGQCVALVRACSSLGTTGQFAGTNAPGWRRGVKVMTNVVAEGTAIARFSEVAPGVFRYNGGHTAFLAGKLTQGGLSLWHCNVEGEFVTWRSLPVGGSGWANPNEYYTIEKS